MSRKLTTEFNKRQYMATPDYEIFYYQDIHLSHVSAHQHEHYEFYFFLDGDLTYEIEDQTYNLKPGDYMLIPPKTRHRPLILDSTIPYRRIILWFSSDYYHALVSQHQDFAFGFAKVSAEHSYHFHPDVITAHEIQGRLIELIEETRSNQVFHDLHCSLKTSAFLAYVNRTVYIATMPQIQTYETPLYLRICDYIDSHLTEDLSLDTLAQKLFLNKYHIAHTFKEHMGISIYQYALKKRLKGIKHSISSNIPLAQLAAEYAFSDYTSFYRAFKKEYGTSPKEYRDSLMSFMEES